MKAVTIKRGYRPITMLIKPNTKTTYKQQYPSDYSEGYFGKIWHRPTLPRVTAVPSALVGLTSLFGMGRGGHHRYRHLNILNVISLLLSLFSLEI
jgi:hypothetical protein